MDAGPLLCNELGSRLSLPPGQGLGVAPESMLASVGAPDPLLEALRKCTGDCGQVTDPEAAQ